MVNLDAYRKAEQDYPAGYLADSASSPASIFLYGLVRLVQPSLILEFGTWEGATSIWLARAVAENRRGRYIGYEIDPEKALATENALRVAVPDGAWTVKNADCLAANYYEADFVFMDHAKNLYPHAFMKVIWPVGAYCIAHDTTSWPEAVKFYDMMRIQREWEVLNFPHERGMMVARKLW